MSGSLAGGVDQPPSSMRGKVVVVTGGNTGIGYATAKALALLGAHVIIACRSEQRAVAAIHQMKEETGGGSPGLLVEYMHLDLASLDSVRKFSETLHDRNQALDALINNAGISWAHYGLTEDGFEQHYQVNHLGHFLLTLELVPLLLATAGRTEDCRVVFVASRRHAQGVFDLSNVNGDTSYSRYAFYNNSKLYNVMTAHALQRRLKESGITVSSLHPGLVYHPRLQNTDRAHDLKLSRLTQRCLATWLTWWWCLHL
jgi:NAD(P)-dependent dehydrogenase (short-subunit alcohol dehydrogenase family)